LGEKTVYMIKTAREYVPNTARDKHIKVAGYSFLKWENMLFRSVFLDKYYLLKHKKHPTHVKHRKRNFLTKVTQNFPQTLICSYIKCLCIR
jgi:hypothetical protein